MKEKNTLSVSCCETELRLPGLGAECLDCNCLGCEAELRVPGLRGRTAAVWAVRRNRDCLRCEAELRLPGL